MAVAAAAAAVRTDPVVWSTCVVLSALWRISEYLRFGSCTIMKAGGDTRDGRTLPAINDDIGEG